MKFKSRQAVHEYLKNSKIDAGDRFVEVLKVLHKYSFTLYSLTNVHKIIPEWYIEYRFLFINNKSIVGSISKDVFNHSHFKELSVEDILSIEIEPKKVIRDGKVAVCYCTRGEGLSRYNHIYPELLFSPKIVEMIEEERQEEITSEWIEKELGIKVVDIGFCDFLTIKWIPEGEQFQITEFDGCEDIWLLKELNNVFTA